VENGILWKTAHFGGKQRIFGKWLISAILADFRDLI
jgi:hypothetical protein